MKPRIAWLLSDWATSEFRIKNNLYGGVGYYRVILPSKPLMDFYDIELIGEDITHWGTEDETFTRLGRDYDLIVSKHITSGKTASNILACAKHYKKKVLVDIDDNYLEMRDDNPALIDYGKGKGGRYFLGAFLGLADGLIVSTDPLKQAYSSLNSDINVLPNTNDIKEWPKPAKKKDGIIRIGYQGGTAHNQDLDLIIEPIAKILEKYKNVTFEVLGALTPEKAREMGAKMLEFGSHKILHRFKIGGGTPSWKGYPELLALQGWDIGLAPLIDETFNQGKSHIKLMEYGMMKMASVVSPVYPYTEPIDGVEVAKANETLLYAPNTEQWFEKIDFLIRNPNERKKIGRQAYTFYKENWQAKQWATKWKKVFDKYL